MILAVPSRDASVFLGGGDSTAARAGVIESLPKRRMEIIEWHPTIAEAVGPGFKDGVVAKLVDAYGATEAARVVYWLE